MITVTLEVNGRTFQQQVDDLSKIPEQIIDGLERQVVPKAQVRFDQKLNASPGPAKQPFEFATDKSRKFYLWAKRTGNLPTYETVRQWKIEGRRVDANTYEIWLVNNSIDSGVAGVRGPVNPAVYVYGPRQVPGHANTGWPNVYLTLADERGNVAADALTVFGVTARSS